MTKTYDCIEDKQRIQRALWDEYQRRRGEFASYVDFINATADEDPDIRAFRDRAVNAGKQGSRDRSAA
jgi:hypothetical protein